MKIAYRCARGQSMVEYGIIVGLIAIMVGTVAIAYGPAMIHWYENRAVTEQQGNAAISELMYANNGISFSEITRSATVVALHQQVAINGRVMNADGSPASGVEVAFTISGGGLTAWAYAPTTGSFVRGNPYTIKTNASGYAGLTFQPVAGSGTPTFTLTATSGIYEATGSISVQVP